MRSLCLREGSIITAIVWDGKILACDGRVSGGTSIVCDTYNKLTRLTGVKYYGDTLLYAGIAGVLAARGKLISLLNNDDYPNVDITIEQCFALIVGKKFIYEFSGSPYLEQFDRDHKHAVGSGEIVARSALSLGLNAIEAVHHAIGLDSGCGGEVRWVEL